MTLLDPFFRSRLPPEHRARDPERARRVRLCGEVFQALLDGRLPSLEASLFVGAAGMSWLEVGGQLDRDHLRVRAPFGSHHGPAYLWRLLRDESTLQGEMESAETGTMAPDSLKGAE